MHTRTNDVGEATTGEDGTEEAPSPEQLAAFRKEVDSAVHNLQCNTCLELKPLRTNMHTHTISTCMHVHTHKVTNIDLISVVFLTTQTCGVVLPSMLLLSPRHCSQIKLAESN